ncbi:PREDICTED: uncharacterized protein LOC107337205 [Acropora digitifera]|uniref:uncharacterized protein LOC107337205 n=1 Tax=Acropora digitifera TaxID=70779 RepID=UPI00077A02BB|nr:PREDICTED: uncharacterized protein LOC107337205 [Acropora digitifera]
MDRILTKYKEEDMKDLKRSGTEEEFTEIQQLCEDILVYRRDMIEIRKIEKESRMKKDQEDKRKGEEMRQAAVERLVKRRSDAGTSGGATCDVQSMVDHVVPRRFLTFRNRTCIGSSEDDS